MPAINFSVFKDKLVKGLKRHTIRKAIPKGWKVGKPLSLYTGMRTKGCHKLVDTFCGNYHQININGRLKRVEGTIDYRAKNPYFNLKQWEIIDLAKNDGFENLEDFWEFFKDYKEPCYLLHFDMQNFNPTQWALEALEKGILK